MSFFMKIISIVLFLPFILYFFIGILLLIIGESIELMVFLVTSLLLFINGYGLYRNEKKWNFIGLISIIIFTIWYSIMGVFDFFKYTSTIIAIILLIFYIIIYIIKILLNKNKLQKNKS